MSGGNREVNPEGLDNLWKRTDNRLRGCWFCNMIGALPANLYWDLKKTSCGACAF